MSIIRGATIDGQVHITSDGEIHREEDGKERLYAIEQTQIYQKGIEEGEKLGYEKALKETHSYLGLLQTIAAKMLEQKQNLLEHLKPEILDFSLIVCEKILRQELSHPEKLAKMIQTLFNAASHEMKGEDVTIFLSPQDLSLVCDHLKTMRHEESASLHFTADPLMRRGDCRIESKSGLLNCTIARELEDLRAKILTS